MWEETRGIDETSAEEKRNHPELFARKIRENEWKKKEDKNSLFNLFDFIGSLDLKIKNEIFRSFENDERTAKDQKTVSSHMIL